MAVTWANLRKATPEESGYARGGSVYQSISKSIWPYLQGREAKKLLADKSNYFLYGQPPLLLRIWTSVKNVFGYKDALTRYPCKNFDRVDVDEKKVIKAILRHFRHGEFFLISKGMKAFEGFFQQCFPGIASDDLILCCKENETKLFHKLLANILQPQCIKDYLPTIRRECEASFDNVENGEIVNATEMVRSYFTRNFGQNIFHNTESGTKLNDHLNTFKQLISRLSCNQSTPDDAIIMQNLVEDVRQTTSEILQENPNLFLVGEDEGNNPLSKEAKCALIFLMLFAAQDNTTTALSAALWYLAAYPHKQEELREACQNYQKNPNGPYSEQLNRFFLEILQDYPAVPGVTRVAAEDLCLEFQLDSNPSIHKTIIFKNEIVVARIDKVGKENLLDHLSFGYGAHKCPGMHYAQAAIKEFLIYALANYQIGFVSPKELKLTLAFTAVLEKDVKIYFNKLRINNA